jgi:hypothetical protein
VRRYLNAFADKTLPLFLLIHQKRKLAALCWATESA